MTNSHTDGQLGMDDIVIHDDAIYRLCMEWDSARNANAGAAKKLKRAKDAKDNALGSLDLSTTETQRFVIRPESDPLPDEPLQYAINVSPPGDARTVQEYEVKPVHLVSLKVVEPE